MAHVVALRWDLGGAAGWSCQAGLAEFLQALLAKLFPLAWGNNAPGVASSDCPQGGETPSACLSPLLLGRGLHAHF